MMAQSHTKWLVLVLAAVPTVLSLTTWFSATAVIPELTRAFDLTASQAAWLTNAVQLGFVVGALGASLLSIVDRYSLTRLMACAALIAGLSNAAILLAPSAGYVIAARFVTGMALAFVYPPAMKFIATWFVQGRGIAMGAMVGALTLGSALPHLIRAMGVGFDWEVIIGASAASAIVAAAIFGFALKEGPHAFARTTVTFRQVGAVLKNRPVMLANLGYFGHMWELYAMWGWMLAYLSAAHGAGQGASLLAFAVIALGAPSCIIAGMAADRFGRPEVTAICMAISGSCAILIGFVFAGPVWLLAIVAAIWGLTVVADSAQFSAMVTELADRSLVGSALAFQMGVGFLITVFTIWLVPVIVDVTGSWRWSFLVLAPGPIVGVWAMLRLRREI